MTAKIECGLLVRSALVDGRLAAHLRDLMSTRQ
jgi:hypothetical protein